MCALFCTLFYSFCTTVDLITSKLLCSSQRFICRSMSVAERSFDTLLIPRRGRASAADCGGAHFRPSSLQGRLGRPQHDGDRRRTTSSSAAAVTSFRQRRCRQRPSSSLDRRRLPRRRLADPRQPITASTADVGRSFDGRSDVDRQGRYTHRRFRSSGGRRYKSSSVSGESDARRRRAASTVESRRRGEGRSRRSRRRQPVRRTAAVGEPRAGENQQRSGGRRRRAGHASRQKLRRTSAAPSAELRSAQDNRVPPGTLLR